MLDLLDNVAVVTGGARRLGAAIALALADAGCHVVINYRTSAADAEQTAGRIEATGRRALAVQGDVARADAVDHLLGVTVRELGRVDVLIANASVFRRTPIATVSDSDWNDLLDNNLRAAFLCAQRFGLHMRAQAGGAIVALADTAGLRPWADYLPYSIAKAGIIAMTHGLAKALAPAVRVNAIAPGPILFPATGDPQLRDREIARTLLKREGRPEHIADAVLALVRNDYITGAVLPVDGGRLLA